MFPLLVYQWVSATRAPNLGGATGRVRPLMQISCWAETFTGARQLADVMETVLDGFRGDMGTLGIDRVELVVDRHDYDDNARLHRIIQDFRFSYARAA